MFCVGIALIGKIKCTKHITLYIFNQTLETEENSKKMD